MPTCRDPGVQEEVGLQNKWMDRQLIKKGKGAKRFKLGGEKKNGQNDRVEMFE